MHEQVAEKLHSDCGFGLAQRFSAAVSTLVCFAALAAEGNLQPAKQFPQPPGERSATRSRT